jgi:acylphosphatase
MKRVEATVQGYVQGVSFRYYTQREALRLGLTGWVRNESDGSVSVVAEGPENNLNRLLDFLRHGPRMAVVKDVSAHWSSATTEFEDFTIRLV